MCAMSAWTGSHRVAPVSPCSAPTSSWTRSRWLTISESRLLMSCATPPASWLRPSSRWPCSRRSCRCSPAGCRAAADRSRNGRGAPSARAGASSDQASTDGSATGARLVGPASTRLDRACGVHLIWASSVTVRTRSAWSSGLRRNPAAPHRSTSSVLSTPTADVTTTTGRSGMPRSRRSSSSRPLRPGIWMSVTTTSKSPVATSDRASSDPAAVVTAMPARRSTRSQVSSATGSSSTSRTRYGRSPVTGEPPPGRTRYGRSPVTGEPARGTGRPWPSPRPWLQAVRRGCSQVDSRGVVTFP